MKVKRLLSVVLLFAVIASIAAVSFAVETRAVTGLYSFTISPPQTGSARASGIVKSTGGMSPWFNPSVYSVPTLYWIYNASSGQGYGVGRVTNSVHTSTPGYQSLTYQVGHGGSGYNYRLVGGSYVQDFYQYTVSGSWSPD